MTDTFSLVSHYITVSWTVDFPPFGTWFSPTEVMRQHHVEQHLFDPKKLEAT